MKVWAEVFTAAGVRQGIVDLVSLHTSQKLDSIGSFDMNIAANNPNNENLLAQGRRVHFYFHDGHRKQFLSQGILQKRQFTDSEGQQIIRWSGSDAMEELRQILTGAGRVFRDAGVEEAATELLGLMPSRWWASVDSGLGNTSIRFDNVSLYRALFSIAIKKGVHVRLANTPNRVLVSALGSDTELRFANTILLPWELTKNPHAVLVERLELVSDAFEVVNWIEPLAGAGAEAALTLEDATLSSPYMVESETGPDGKTHYFIQDATSIASYGKIQKVLMLQDLVPVRAEFEAWRNGANILYEWAAAQLTRSKDPHTSYSTTVRGLRKVIYPGDQVRLSYKGKVWQFGEVVTIANINALFWVVDIEYLLDESGLSAKVTLSSTDINASSAATMLADGMIALRDGQVAVQLGTERLDDTQSTQAIEVIQRVPSSVNLQFRPSTVSLVQAKMTISRNETQGPDTLIIDVDNQKYPLNILGGATLNEETIDIRRMLIDRSKSGIDIQDQHTILVEPTYSRGPLTLNFDIVEASASVATDALSNKEIAEFASVDQNDVGLGDGTYDSLAQTFTADETESFYGAMFRLKKAATPLFDRIRSKVFEGEFGDGALHQPVEGSDSDLVSVVDLSSYYKDRFFHTPDMPSLAAGEYSVKLMSEIVEGLVLAADLDEASGDRSCWTGDFTLVDNGTVTQAAGPDSETPAALFVAANSEHLSAASGPDISEGLTIECRIYANSFSSYGSIVTKGSWDDNLAFDLGCSSGGYLHFYVSPDGTYASVVEIVSASPLSTSTWYKVWVRYDGSNLEMRIDATDETPVSYSSDIYSADLPFTVGQSNNGATFWYWDGRIAGLRLWDRALSDDEVDARQAGDSTNHVLVAADEDITEDLLSLWRLEEGVSGADRIDSWGSNHLSDNNSLGAVNGVLGTAAHFKASSSQFLSITDAAQSGLDITGDEISIMTAIYLDSLTSSGGYGVVSKYRSASQAYLIYIEYPTNVIRFLLNTSSGVVNVAASTFGALSAGVWYWIFARYDGTTLKISVNGIQTTLPQTGTIVNSDADFTLGAYENGSSAHFDGSIDHTAIWGRCISDNEEARLYNAGDGLAILPLNYYRYGRLMAESSGEWASKIMDADFKALRTA